ncbi:MAG: hypothetical protein IJ855_04420 [Bacteroidales bacterium]|nr:hypothetical protein [Bacteroidales bacterium]
METFELGFLTGRVHKLTSAREGPICENPYADLAAAIVKSAVKDYVENQKSLWLGEWRVDKRKLKLLLEKIQLEAFFYSGWYDTLTDLDSDQILAQCRFLGKERAKNAVIKRNHRLVATMMVARSKEVNR